MLLAPASNQITASANGPWFVKHPCRIADNGDLARTIQCGKSLLISLENFTVAPGTTNRVGTETMGS